MTNHDDRNYNKEPDFTERESDSTSVEQELIENNQKPGEYSYLEHNNSQSNSLKPFERDTPKRSKLNNKWSIFFSSLAGGLTVALAGFFLLTTGVIDLNETNSSQVKTKTTTNSDASAPNETASIIQTVSNEDSSNSLTTALERVSDAVVGVTNIQQNSLWAESQKAGTGSGVVYKKENGKAYVVTNNHVVEGANEVEVILTNGEKVKAEVLGADELTDLAVLVMDGSKVTQVAPLGSSDNLVVGETAIAIGNPLGTEFAGSVTRGIISGLERSVEMDLNSDGQPDWTTEVIQTDAAINPGNSGGALINSQGEVIGINSMKISLETVEGIGFAIPIDAAKPIIEQLETEGSVVRPFIGISAISLSTVPEVHKQRTLNLNDKVTDGVVVAETQKDSPADQAGLKQYDVITKINDTPISSMMDLKQLLYGEKSIGDEITITYYRKGEQHTTSLTLTKQ